MKEREEGTGDDDDDDDDDAYKFYPHILFIQSLSSMHMQCVQTADFHVSKSTLGWGHEWQRFKDQ